MSQHVERRKPEWAFYATAVVATAVVCAVVAWTRVSDYARSGRSISYLESLAWDETSGLAMLVLLPLITAFARRFDITRPPHWRAALAHIAATVPFSLVHVTLMGLFRWAGYAALGRGFSLVHLLGDWFYEYRKDVITYASVIGIYWGWRAIRRSAAEAGARPAPPGQSDVQIEVRDGARRAFIRPDDIAWIEAAGNYAELHLAGRSLLHRASLASLEARLAGAGFARIHRARLVNRAQIAVVATNAAGDFTVTLRDGRELGGSRRYRAGVATTTRLESARIAD